VPIAEDPLEALGAEFAGVERSSEEPEGRARETALDEAGR